MHTSPFHELPEDCVIELPEDLIIPESDVLARFTPSDQIWGIRRPETFDANMSKAAIFHAHATGQIGAVEAFHALVNYELVDFEQILFMLSVQHRTAQIIEGED